MKTVLFIPGTFERASRDGYPTGALRRVADLLPSDRFTCVQVLYPMAYGNPIAYDDSVEAGIRALLAAIKAAPGPVYLIGYSQGAVVVARVAAEIRDGKHPGLQVAMVVTIANPERAWGEGLNNVPGSGIAGGRTLAGCPFPVVQLALPDDAITSASRDSLLRNVADLSGFMSGDVVAWVNRTRAELTVSRLQNEFRWHENAIWMLGRTPGRVVTALRELAGYPRVHTSYGARVVAGTNVDHLTYAAQRIQSSQNGV